MKTALPNKNQSVIDFLAEDNANHVSDVELLSLFINARDGVSAKDRAVAILGNNTLMELMRCEHGRELRKLGVSKRQLAQLHAGMELAKRSVLAKLERGSALQSPQDVKDYLMLQLAGRKQEIFCVIYLNNRHQVIRYSESFIGTTDSCAVYPAEICREMLRVGAIAAIIGHQHPSGISTPSDTDIRLTKKINDAFSVLDFRLLDHIVCGQGEYTSLAERGLM